MRVRHLRCWHSGVESAVSIAPSTARSQNCGAVSAIEAPPVKCSAEWAGLVTRIRRIQRSAQTSLETRSWRLSLAACECVGGQVHSDRGWSLDPSKDERRPEGGTGADQPEPSSGPARQSVPHYPAASTAQKEEAFRSAASPPIYPVLLTPATLCAVPLHPVTLHSVLPVSPQPVALHPVLVAAIDLSSTPALRPVCCHPALDAAEAAADGPLIVTRTSVVTGAAGEDEEGKMSQGKKKAAGSRIMLVKRILMKDGSPVSVSSSYHSPCHLCAPWVIDVHCSPYGGAACHGLLPR